MRRALFLLALANVGGCNSQPPAPPYVEPRADCAQRNPQKSVFYGDLHVHTSYSFDAHMFDVITTPSDAYRFARGESVALPPLDDQGNGTRMVHLDRPLDFAAVTDHSEFLGEVEECTLPDAPAYGSPNCVTFRNGGNLGVTTFGILLTAAEPTRFADVCGPDNSECAKRSSDAWGREQSAAEEAYDRTSACQFTSLVAYEYSGAPDFSTMHRNVIFRTDRVPSPVTYMEQPTPQQLWQQLQATCLDGLPGCDVLAIPHNSNESNGNMFWVEYPGANSPTDEQAQAAQRVRLEPLVEIYQHKAASECMNGLAGVLGATDEQCAFEAPRRDPIVDCGDMPGADGIVRRGCFSRLDFVRGVLLEGMKEEIRIGVNPYQLGIIASTDTHNGTPGMTDEWSFQGHRGLDDDTPAKRLGTGNLTPGGVEFGPGGLAAVWAEENTRPAIFDALRRRETYGTSGPRITVRFFGGWSLSDGICDDPALIDKAYAGGVPMGGTLGPRPDGAAAPLLVVSALRDPGTAMRPGAPLERIQIVKGWIDGGDAHQQVFDVAGGPTGATVDLATCTASGPGHDGLCAAWRDPVFDPAQHAYYYARVLENPTCRWTTFTCNALAPADRPPSCTDPNEPRTIQERAWTSPIWYRPPG
jgi:hypothetical protein